MGFCGVLLENALNSSLKGDAHIHKAGRVHKKGLAREEQGERELGQKKTKILIVAESNF